MKIVEYVPLITPTIIVKAKPRSTSPPKTNSASTANKVVPEVMIVRLRVWLMLALTSVAKSSRRMRRRFSRTRSKTTIESFTEYPVIVSIAATTFRDSS